MIKNPFETFHGKGIFWETVTAHLQANSDGMGHNLHGSSVPHQYGHTHHTSQPHDAKMAEKIVSELQVK